MIIPEIVVHARSLAEERLRDRQEKESQEEEQERQMMRGNLELLYANRSFDEIRGIARGTVPPDLHHTMSWTPDLLNPNTIEVRLNLSLYEMVDVRFNILFRKDRAVITYPYQITTDWKVVFTEITQDTLPFALVPVTVKESNGLEMALVHAHEAWPNWMEAWRVADICNAQYKENWDD